MTPILGSGGSIGNELVKLLSAKNQPFRLVSRSLRPSIGAAEVLAADLTDKEQTIRAVAGSSVVHLVIGFTYDHKVWQGTWPRVMSNTIEACKRASAKLIFFDDVYMYGKVSGTMTAAGQTVEHAHVHVIPRRKEDVTDPRGGIRWIIDDKARYWNR